MAITITARGEAPNQVNVNRKGTYVFISPCLDAFLLGYLNSGRGGGGGKAVIDAADFNNPPPPLRPPAMAMPKYTEKESEIGTGLARAQFSLAGWPSRFRLACSVA